MGTVMSQTTDLFQSRNTEQNGGDKTFYCCFYPGHVVSLYPGVQTSSRGWANVRQGGAFRRA